MPDFTGVAHVAVTVRDMEATVAWWERLFGFKEVSRAYEPPGEQRHPRILIRHDASGLVLGIHQPYERSGDSFDPSRTGLDHISLSVAERSDLDRWMAFLDEQGVAHSPVRDLGHAAFITLEDPDGMQVELWWANT